MPWVKSFEGLVDFLSLVIVHAPDSFPREDYLNDDEQLTLEKAFAELKQGMSLVAKRINDPAALDRLRGYLEDAFTSYEQGEVLRGAHLLQAFEEELLRSNG